MWKPSDFFQPPDQETARKMLLDLNEDPQRLKKQIELFKEWLKCESYLPKNVGKFGQFILSKNLNVNIWGISSLIQRIAQNKRKITNSFTDHHLILNFIRHCKCDLEKAKKKFVNYLALRDKFQNYYSKPDLSGYFHDIAIHR